MRKTALSTIATLLILLVTFPLMSPAFAASSTSVTGEVEDVNNDQYPDMQFEATDSFGNPVEGVDINVTAEYMTESFLSGSTNSSGLLVFRTVPAGNYTWVSSTGDIGDLEVEPIEFDVPDELAFLMLFLNTKWCENTTEKGKSLLKGIADMAGYGIALPETAHIVDNYERAILYYSWLCGLEDYVLAQKIHRLGVFTDVQMNLIFATKSMLKALGMASKISLTPPSLTWATDGYVFNYLVDRGGALPLNQIFAIRNGFQGFGLIVISLYDLFIFEGTDVVVRVVTLGEATWEETISVAYDFATLSTGVLRLAAALGRAVGHWGAAVSIKLMFAVKALGGIGCFLGAILVLLDLQAKYGGNWNRVAEELLTPYVLLTMAEAFFLIAAGAVFFAQLLGVVAIAGIALGPIGVALLMAAAIIAVVKAIWDWINEYWAYQHRIQKQLSMTMDSVIPIRQHLYSYNLTTLQEEAETSLRIADLVSQFAEEIEEGELKDDLEWTNEYFIGLNEAQVNFKNSIDEARPVVDKIIKTVLNYTSPEDKKIVARLEGINCTNAQYLGPGSTDSFYFKSAVYHPSESNPDIFVFDNHTITYDNLDGEYYPVYEYSKISRHEPLDLLNPQKGWAWESPREHDAHNRSFAITYTTDPSHHPSGTPTGSNFYFDAAGQPYTWPPFPFDPDATYRDGCNLVPDPQTGNTSFFYQYKIFFDREETDFEWWGYGRPDALEPWMQNITQQTPILRSALNNFTSALDKLRQAFSARRGVFVSDEVDKGIAWLRTSQYSDGSWRSSVGVTALAVLTLLNAGYDESDLTVQKAILYLLSKVHGDGTIYVGHQTYETSLALMALVATHNSTYQTTIDAARDWLVNSQWDESCLWGSVSKDSWYYGGFGYGSHTRPDLSNTQFAALALDAAGLPQDDPTWVKLQVFLHRCQKVNFPINLTIDGGEYTVQPWNYAGSPGGYDGGFLYIPGDNPYGAEYSMGSMTGAGIWGLLLSGVSKTDQRVTEAINWVVNHYTWETNYGCAGYRRYYYYLSMAKALTMYGKNVIDGHDWYQDLHNKIESEIIPDGTDQGYWSVPKEDYGPDLTTAYAVLSLQTRAGRPPVQRLSYLTVILRSNALVAIRDSEGRLVGYNPLTGLGENMIPNAVYSGPSTELQYIIIINPELGTYDLELIGISEGPYELTIQAIDGIEVADEFEYPETPIEPGEIHAADVTISRIVGFEVYVPEPPEPPALAVSPKNWTEYEVLPSEEISATFTISETTNSVDLQNVALVASDLTYGLFSIPSSCISLSDDNLTVPKGSHKNVTVTLAVPPDTVYGNYTGSILITSKEGGDAIILMRIEVVRATLYGDINDDGSVNILDIIVLVDSFGSEPGDPNWNPDADLKDDGIINILDAILIARNFGKTI